jgi:hypothetical protein
MNMDNIETLHQSLNKQIMNFDEKAHQTQYFHNLHISTLPIESQVGYLRVLAIIYGTLENQFTKLEQPDFNALFKGYTPKLPLILADLESLNAKTIKDIIPAVNIALQLADKILLYSIKNPFKLFGFRYILDGSFQRDVDSNERNNQFGEILSTKIIDNQIKEDIISAAREITNDMLTIYENLYPVDENHLGNHITALNPEAGNYPIPTNPLEIEAAISAGLKCWDEFSFYEKRYGERGKRFTISDSVWLVTLPELSIELAINQVKWLAKYLANRGMPVITMEYHLKYLYQELIKRIPDSEEKYQTLLAVSELLKNQRIENVPSLVFEKSNSLFQDFCVTLNVREEPMKNTGILIASSIADNLNGMNESLQNFKMWITNPELFSKNWIKAIENCYTTIEKQLKS